MFISNPTGMRRVIAQMATYPARREVSEQAIRSLLGQVHILRVCLNQYSEIPGYLQSEPNVEAFIPEQDCKDVGKFVWENRPDDVILLVDDDIIYPEDYATRMEAKLQRYERSGSAIVGLHGVIYSDFFYGSYLSRVVWPFSEEYQTDFLVNQLGTGTVAAYGKDLPSLSYMASARHFVDIRLARHCFESGIALISIERPAQWLKPLRVDGDTIFNSFTAAGSYGIVCEVDVFGGFSKLDPVWIKRVGATI